MSPTFLSKDPPLVHAGGEEDGRLGDAHQQVCDGQVDDEHVSRRPQAATPAKQHVDFNQKQRPVYKDEHRLRD